MGKKLLLAEDSLTIRKVFELALEKTGISITSVDNGDDAVRLAGEIFPDLVVADANLPGVSGFDVALALKGQRQGEKAIPVLLLAGTLAPFDDEKFKASGASGVMFKPFETKELLARIEEVTARVETVDDSAPSPVTPSAPSSEEVSWDFTDVLKEVDADAAKIAPSETAGPAIELDEYSVAPSPDAFPVSHPHEDAVLSEPVADIVSDEPLMPIPQDFSAIAPALEGIEEFEEIDDLEPMETVMEPPVAEIVQEAEALEPEVVEVEAEHAFVEAEPEPEPVPEPAPEPEPEPEPEPYFVAPVPVPAGLAIPESVSVDHEEEVVLSEVPPSVSPQQVVEAEPVAPSPSPAHGPSLEDSALREAFAARSKEAFEKVAAEVIERVLWDHMEKLSVELSSKIRETVEAVAWEVVPAAADALIREEIERMRALSSAAKK